MEEADVMPTIIVEEPEQNAIIKQELVEQEECDENGFQLSIECNDTSVTANKSKSGYTNIQRYNVLVKAYIDAHPHLPRQMQYAEAQQVWRSVRMDPEGAYLAVLRSLHGMALLVQASSDPGAAPEPPKELHPLLLQAIDPAMDGILPLPPVAPTATVPAVPPTSTVLAVPPTATVLAVPPPPPMTPPKQTPNSAKPTENRPRRIYKQRGRPPKNRHPNAVQNMPPTVKRGPGRPRKIKPIPIVPVIKRGVGRPRKIPVVQQPAMPVSQELSILDVRSIERPNNKNATVSPPAISTVKLENVNIPSFLIVTPVTNPVPQSSSDIPEEPPLVSVSTNSAAAPVTPDLSVSISVPSKPDSAMLDQWEPQPGISFVQGNGLKMILSRVNNGQPLPEYRRRSRKRSRPKPRKSVEPSDMPACGTAMLRGGMSPTQGQPADSTVMDTDTEGLMSSAHFECSPDQPFAAAILQYLLDLSELLGSTTSFVISQETEQKSQNTALPNVSVYSGWLVGEQSIGPKLVASIRMSNKTNEVHCLSQLVNKEDFREVIRTSYGRVKPVAILILEGRKPGDLVDLLDDMVACFKEWNLDSIILASQPAVGQHVLSTLDNSADGHSISSNGCHSSTDHHMKTKTMEVEQWKNRHLRSGQYYLQIAKCADQNCCLEWRTPLRKVLPPQGFLPPPVPFAKGEQGPMAPRFEERDMATYGRLCERLVMESLVPRTAFQELPFDFYCPSARESLSKRVCFDCGHYFCTLALRKLHSQLLHPNYGNR